ncbi:50S ribosomal protein L10 [Oceanicaulis sp.]|jgi:large subunit ribosomal protein L10|uniref:50S ribosomal protein L10 n=1 Tax=Oceanicaulis sp. TaxID=1924941 RepID=UPI000D320CB8
MDRTTKEAAVEELSEIFESTGSVVLTRYSGLTVAEMTKLRGDLREVGGKLKVVRNRLAKIALKDKKGEAASDMFEGPVAIAYSEDFTAAPKVVVEFAKSNDKFELVGGFMEEEIFDAKGVEALSKMPSREELIGAIAGRLLGQAGEIVSRVTAPGNTLAAQIETIREQAEA